MNYFGIAGLGLAGSAAGAVNGIDPIASGAFLVAAALINSIAKNLIKTDSKNNAQDINLLRWCFSGFASYKITQIFFGKFSQTDIGKIIPFTACIIILSGKD